MSSAHDLEEGLAFTPKFDANGLITAVVTDAKSGDVLMVAHMNEEALRKTIASGEAWYFSRSRKALWKKGETSGHVQRVVELRVDCDQDAVWLRVDQQSASGSPTPKTLSSRRVPAPAIPAGAPVFTVLSRSARAVQLRSSFATRTKPSIRIWPTSRSAKLN